MLIDTHCHLDWESYQEDLVEVLKRANESGVEKIVTIGTDKNSLEKTRILVTRFAQVFRCIGFHPDCVLEEGFDLARINEYMQLLEKEVEFPQTVGIGECGLDYYCLENAEIAQQVRDDKKELQKELFERQILFAIQHSLPLSLHVRDTGEDAYRDVISLLEEYFGEGQDYDTLSYGFSLANFQKKYSAGEDTTEHFDPLGNEITGAEELRGFRGVLHCVSGPAWYVDRCIELGFCISFAGNVTYKNAGVIAEHASRVPLNKIVVETDGPFLSPQSIRGERNEPKSVVEIATKIADLKGISFDEVAKQTTENAEKLFSI